MALATTVSLSRPLSFDEMYWLTVARRIFGAGDLPYVDLLDNKGPLLYGLFGLADLIPVGERGALTILFVAVAAALAIGTWRLASRSGQPPGWRLFSAGLVSLTMMSLSVWAVTTEFIASAFVVWAFTARNPWGRVTCVLAACLVDPRAVLFAPIVVFDGWRRDEVGIRHVSALAGLAVAALGTVMAVPALRYAFVEASLATRFDANPRDLLLVTTAALSPLLVMGTLRLQRIPPAATATLAVALLVGFSAGLPYGHYWVYVVLAVPLLTITGPRFSPAVTGIMAVGALLAVTLATRDHFAHDVEEARVNEPVATAVEGLVRRDDRVLVWASSPHLRFRVAERTLGFAPTSNYFAWGLPDPDGLLDRLADDLSEATLIVVDPGLEAYRGFPTVAAALDLVSARTAETACSFPLDGSTAYRFEGC